LGKKSERGNGKNWSVGLASIWQNQYEHNNSAVYRVVEGRCNDIERQNLFSRLSEKISLVVLPGNKTRMG
jgi:hypothetical protein